MEKNVVIGRLLRDRGIRENKRGFPTGLVKIFGADTETCKGVPFTVQFASQNHSELRFTDPNRILRDFTSMALPHCARTGWNLVFFHNLNFDLRALFHRHLRALYDQYNDIRLDVDGYKIRMLFGRVNSAIITAPGGIKIRCLDSAAFCPPGSKSLEKALLIYGVPGKKLTAPPGLGEKILRSPAFQRYAVNDAIQVQKLGQKIIDVHRKYDITPTVSLPMLAGKIFRHHFFKASESYTLPPDPCRKASEFAYHAGKNGFYVERGVYENVIEYDINSAFPRAMREMPQLVRGHYETTRDYVPGRLGVYEVSGVVRNAKYPALWDHAFRPVSADFSRLWCTGYEVDLMRGDPSYQFRVRQGWIWVPHPGHDHNPLKEYIDHFWKLKSEAPAGPIRDLYKNLLNSLYGKFAACVEKRPTVETSIGRVALTEGARYWQAGSLYHPFLAAQITGYVRRELTLLERKGRALHAATDSIKSLVELPTSNTLGGLKKEVQGRCYLFRTKLYLHFARDFSLCKHDPNLKSLLWDKGGQSTPQHLCKYALHGFKGNAYDLFKNRHLLLKQGFLKYTYRHMVGLREGFKRREIISAMTTRKECLLLKPKVVA